MFFIARTGSDEGWIGLLDKRWLIEAWAESLTGVVENSTDSGVFTVTPPSLITDQHSCTARRNGVPGRTAQRDSPSFCPRPRGLEKDLDAVEAGSKPLRRSATIAGEGGGNDGDEWKLRMEEGNMNVFILASGLDIVLSSDTRILCEILKNFTTTQHSIVGFLAVCGIGPQSLTFLVTTLCF